MSEFPNISIVLVEPETPGNVGFIARVMSNFGVKDLRIAGEDLTKEEEAIRFSVHATDVLENAKIFGTLEEVLHDIDNAWAATARAGRNHSVTRALVPLEKLPDPLILEGHLAIVFGRESSGLTNEEVDQCDLAFTIPTSEEYASMNLSHAIAVTLYHLYTTYAPETETTHTEARVATRNEKEQVAIFFDDVIDELSIKEYRIPIAKRVFRNLLGRAYMTGREVTTLTGTIRKIRDALKKGDTIPEE